jgi:hypothetical protein
MLAGHRMGTRFDTEKLVACSEIPAAASRGMPPSPNWIISPTSSADRSVPSGVRRLCFALLESAINDLKSGASRDRQKAREWIQASRGGTLSLETVADAIGVEVGHLRAQLLAMKVNPAARIRRTKYAGGTNRILVNSSRRRISARPESLAFSDAREAPEEEADGVRQAKVASHVRRTIEEI